MIVKFNFFLFFCGSVVEYIFYRRYLSASFLFKRNYFFKHFFIVNPKIKVRFFSFFSFFLSFFCIKLLSNSCLSVSATATKPQSTLWLIDNPVIAYSFDFLNFDLFYLIFSIKLAVKMLFSSMGNSL